jgi:hypothetical protein
VIVAFLGPSLPKPALRGFDFRPPARQGDVWRALDDGATAIALIDGVFESQPSVWHHELLDALAEGVPVIGGASMGALRAAELHTHGMRGVGQIFSWYRDGTIIDDAEVALLHADAEHGFRALTVPQVNVRWSAEKQLPRAAARKVIEASARIFYQDRTPQRVRELLPPGFQLLELKAADARLTLQAAARARPPRPGEQRSPSSLVRRARLPALQHDPQLADEGLRRALLAGQARELGLRATAEDLRAAGHRWQTLLDVRDHASLLRRTGLRPAAVEALKEELALERLMLDHAARMLSDGPSPDEALANELRLRGAFGMMRP